MLRRRPAAGALLVLVLLGCGPSDRPPAARVATARAHLAMCDSAQAARVTLDSLRQRDRFRSAVHRYARDAAGHRIVTIPDDDSLVVVDGMAVVTLDTACGITSVVQADSA